MKIFDIFRKSKTFRAILFWKGNQPVWTPKDYVRLTKAGYLNCMTVYACVNILAKAVGGIPWVLYKKPGSKRGKIVELEEHPLVDLIHRPNPLEGQSFFFQKVTAYLYLAGNSYIERVGPKVGPPKELYSVRPDRMKVIPGGKQLVSGYQYEVAGQKVPFNFNQILHLKLFHPLDDFYGLSPLEVASKGIDISNMALHWNAKLLENDARPPGALVTEGNLTEEQYERLNKEIKEKISGYENAGNPLLLEAGLDWKQFGLSPKDMDWLNSDKVMTRKICTVYGVPPELLGDTEQKTFSNYKEARQAFYTETILPFMDILKAEFNNWLTPQFGERLYLDYDRDEIEAIQEDRNKVWDRATEGVKTGILTINEGRSLLGYEEIDGGDIILIPGNMIPLMTLSKNIIEE